MFGVYSNSKKNFVKLHKAQLLVLFFVIVMLAPTTRAWASGYLLLNLPAPSANENFLGRLYSHFALHDDRMDWTFIVIPKIGDMDCDENLVCGATLPVLSHRIRKDDAGRLHILGTRTDPGLEDFLRLYPGAREQLSTIVDMLLRVFDGAVIQFNSQAGNIQIANANIRNFTKSLRFVRADLHSAQNAIYFSSIVEAIFLSNPRYCIIEQVLKIRNSGPRLRDERMLLLAVNFVARWYRTAVAAYHQKRRLKGLPYDASIASDSAKVQTRAIDEILLAGVTKLARLYQEGKMQLSDEQLISLMASALKRSNVHRQILDDFRKELLATVRLGAKYEAKLGYVGGLSKKESTDRICKNILLN